MTNDIYHLRYVFLFRKLTVRRVKLYQGYTKHGMYFGTGAKLWSVECEQTGNHTYIRALDLKAAKQYILSVLPDASFTR